MPQNVQAAPVAHPVAPLVGTQVTPPNATPTTLNWNTYGEGTTNGNTVNLSFAAR